MFPLSSPFFFSDQVDTSGFGSLFTPVQTPVDLSTPSSQPATPTPSSTPITPAASPAEFKPTLGIISFLKSKFFGKKINCSDANHAYSGTGVVIGVEKNGNFFYFNLHAVNTSEVFKAKVIFEKDLFGVSFRQAAESTISRNTAKLDTELRINQGIAPILDQSSADVSLTPSNQAPVSSPTSINSLGGEDILYYNPNTQDYLPATLVFFRGRPYFKQDGCQVFIRAEIER